MTIGLIKLTVSSALQKLQKVTDDKATKQMSKHYVTMVRGTLPERDESNV
jgi:hypothetical protein